MQRSRCWRTRLARLTVASKILLSLALALGCGSSKTVEKVHEAEESRIELQETVKEEVVPAIVEAAGSSMAEVVKITTFLTDVNDYAAYGKVRSETFPNSPPASSTVIVAALVRPEFLVEVEAVAHIPG